jgi:hypothetical protein
VYYIDGYPDELPKLSLELLEGEIDEEEMNDLLDGAQAVVSILACL